MTIKTAKIKFLCIKMETSYCKLCVCVCVRIAVMLMSCVSEPNRCAAGGSFLFDKDWLRDF